MIYLSVYSWPWGRPGQFSQPRYWSLRNQPFAVLSAFPAVLVQAFILTPCWERFLNCCPTDSLGSISRRLGVPPTLMRWAFSSKTQRFENALESLSKRKRLRIVLPRPGRKRIKMKSMPENIKAFCVCSKFNWRHNVQFYRFGTF